MSIVPIATLTGKAGEAKQATEGLVFYYNVFRVLQAKKLKVL